MVLQFLRVQIKAGPNQREALSLSIAQAFGRSQPTAWNIADWEKSWVEDREIPERKMRNDGDSWMYDEDVNNSIRNFARIQGDSKCFTS